MQRIEPTGWDSDDRTYYILDDNRLYRMTQAPPTPVPWKPKKNTKKAVLGVCTDELYHINLINFIVILYEVDSETNLSH